MDGKSDPLAEVVASQLTIQPPIGATLYCPSWQHCGWRTNVEDGLRAIERQAGHIAECEHERLHKGA